MLSARSVEPLIELANAGVAVPLGRGRFLSPMQRGLWASQLNHPGAPLQNMPLLSHIDGPIDPERLAAAFAAVVAGSDALRTRITGSPGQQENRWQIELLAAEDLPDTEIVELSRADTEDWARARGAVPVDLAVAGYDSALAVHDDETVSWYLNLHHVITDATSSALVFEATAAVYDSVSDSGDTPTAGEHRSASYYGWSRRLSADLDRAARPATKRAVDYWRAREAAPRIGRLYRAVDSPTTDAERLPLALGPELLRRAQERLSGDFRMLTDDLAWSTLLTTATAVYIHRMTGASQFAVGLPIHNRSDPESRAMIGPTMEVFPVDISIEAEDTFRSLHKRISRSVLTTLRYAAPGTSPAADYEAVINVIVRAGQQRFGSVPVETRWLHSGAIDSSHLLRVQMTAYSPDSPADVEHAGPVGTEAAGPQPTDPQPTDRQTTDPQPTDRLRAELALDLNHGAADPIHRARASGHFTSVLSALVDDPDASIGSSNLCGPDELDELRRWESGADFDSPTTLIIERLREALAENDATVIVQPAAGLTDPTDGSDRTVTGAELWRWVLTLVDELERLGADRGARVGIELPRSIEAVVAIIATMAVGGSFVPLDPNQPESRRRRLSARAGCAVVLSSVAEINALGPAGESQDRPGRASRSAPPTNGPSPTDEAYLLFTSGSTGEPKGVPITHEGLARYIRFAEQQYSDTQSPPVAALFSPLTFDLTITSLFMPILAGGTLVIIEPDGPAGLSMIARRPEINWCKATPSHLEILIRLLGPEHQLATLVVGGEAFGSQLGQDLLAFNPDLRIFNEYGPTEAVVGCMIYRLEPDLLASRPEVAIGRPAPGVTLQVVDDYLQRVPIGAVGELCIAHVGLTRGYLRPDGSPHSTANDAADRGEADVGEESPFVEIDGRRFYRSGDLVRLTDGERLVYLGRKDEQVKVGGIRLEPIEVEARLNAHPGVERSAVRLWSPAATTPRRHCRRCGLPDNVPGVDFDAEGVCATCHSYDRVAPITKTWFRTPADLQEKLTWARATRTGDYDCLHLLSGGKDSTYALYQLVEQGFRPYALTLDNGFISDEAKDNARRSVADLGVDHEFATSDSMNAIFRDSLQRYSNVCHGCYKTIYTLATSRAAEIGAPLIVTGLSRGQLFETRLIPQQFSSERFDPEAIDRAVLQARKIYHRVDDGPNRLLDNSVFDDDAIFDRIEYLDLYRYLDVELAEMLQFLDERAPWVRPSDTGRSTNCLINAAGIHTHKTEQGFHNYAVPYAWDVRLGHKTRAEAIEELDDRLDQESVEDMLSTVGYTPRPREVLTAWVEQADSSDEPPSPAEFRSFLADSLPAHAIPSAYVTVDKLPLSSNGKLDVDALPAPARFHRPGPALQVGVGSRTAGAQSDELEGSIIELWERILQIEPIQPDDDFFALGGDSLAALEMIVALGDRREQNLSEDLAFLHTTPSALAAAIQLQQSEPPARSNPDSFSTPPGQGPIRSSGELAVLFDQASRPDEVMYNVGRLYRLQGSLDSDGFARALRVTAARHQPLCWTHGSPRRQLPSAEAVQIEISTDAVSQAEFDRRAERTHRAPFDLENGPLLRCLVQPIDDGSTAVVLAIHHASGDASSFSALWDQISAELSDPHRDQRQAFDYAGFCAWQAEQLTDGDRDYWLASSGDLESARLAVRKPATAEPDGFLSRRATVTTTQLRSTTGSSPAALTLAAVAATVRRFSSGPEIEVGLITSTRNHSSAEDLFGYFLNTMPIRIHCPAGSSADLLAPEIGAAIGGALAHRSYPLARIGADRAEQAMPAPNLDVLMAFDELDDTELAGIPTAQQVLSNGTAVAPLTFFVEVRGDYIELSLEHRGAVIGRATANQMIETLNHLLSQAVGDQGRPEGDQAAPSSSPVVNSDGRISDEPTALPTSLLIGQPLTDQERVIERIESRLDSGGSAHAVVCGDQRLSWDGLNRRARVVAGLLADRGVEPGHRVVICLPRSVDLVAAIIGTQLAGAAYVPIDPTYPAARIELIAEAAQAAVGVVDRAHGQLVDQAIVVTDSTIDDRPWDDHGGSGPRRRPIGDTDPAYLIFTSGSTGRPRGVAVSHGNLAASTSARRSVYPETPRRFLMLSSPAFDSSIVGLFWTLAEGGTIVLPTEEQAHDLRAVQQLFQADTSHTLLVPTLYQGLLGLAGGPASQNGEAARRWPERVIVAGEVCPANLVAAHFERFPESALTNEYGPTEATVWASAHHCLAGDDPVPIGSPIPGAWLAVVDDAGVIVPAGVEGQLLVGGPGVVDGYFENSEATEERFGVLEGRPGRPEAERLSSPRYFRTGDRAVVVDDQILFLGRLDSQLNVGGIRAEPEEIENVLLGVPGITAVAVVAVDVRELTELLDTLPADVVAEAMTEAASATDPASALLSTLQQHGQPQIRLVAHVEVADDLPTDALRERATAALPALLRPSHYEPHRRLPTTPNGKLDRQAAALLPTSGDPAMSDRRDTAGMADATETTDAADELTASLAELFATVLRVPSFDHDADFFDNGGHSLLAMELLLAIEDRHQRRLPASAIYAAPTPRTLAAGMARNRAESTMSFLVPIQPNGHRPPIFAVHVLGVDCQFFRPLSARLGPDQPMYGLGQPTTDLDTSGPTDVTEVAAAYVSEINRVAPDGPITLAAISLGGVVAYELAQQLTAGGRQVSLLALFDAFGPDATTDGPSTKDRLAAHFQRISSDPAGYLASQADLQGQRLRRNRERVELALRSRLEARTDHQLEVRRFIEANIASQAAYRYDPYPGPILVVKAGDDPFAERHINNGMGWMSIAVGGIEFDRAPGTHLSMMAEPNVGRVAESIERSLAAASARHRSPSDGIDLETVERLMTGALRIGRLPTTVARLSAEPQLDEEARVLVDRADRLLTGLAEATRSAAEEATDRLNAGALSARSLPVPKRVQHATGAIRLEGRPESDVGPASKVMETLDFLPVGSGSPAALRSTVRANGHVDYVRRGSTTSRLRLQWTDDNVGRSPLWRLTDRLQPTQNDFDMVRLPEWAWPAYWPVRPVRVARDRLRSRAPGRPAGGTAPPANLGIFLGTPIGLIGPLLEFAGIEPDQLVIDIGCGDGRVLIEAVRRFDCRARGYETDRGLVDQATAAAERAGVSDRVEILHQDAAEASFTDANIVFAFLPPKMVAAILPRALEQLSPGSTFLSHEQMAVTMPIEPDRSQLIVGLDEDPTDGGITVANLWRGTRSK